MVLWSPHICWRLVQLLIPLQALLIAVREQVQKDDLTRGGEDADPSVPFMEEFLDFVCEDKTIVLEPEDWPDYECHPPPEPLTLSAGGAAGQ